MLCCIFAQELVITNFERMDEFKNDMIMISDMIQKLSIKAKIYDYIHIHSSAI